MPRQDYSLGTVLINECVNTDSYDDSKDAGSSESISQKLKQDRKLRKRRSRDKSLKSSKYSSRSSEDKKRQNLVATDIPPPVDIHNHGNYQ